MDAWRRSGGVAALFKWMGLVAAIWVQAFAGNTFAYSNYSATLKSVLELNQVQLNYLALCKDVGENLGILAGLLCNRVRPWVILSIAALQGFLGFGFLWLVASRTINPRPLWQMCLAIFVGGNSMTWFNTAVLVTCMRNFPNTRGTIVGFLKGFIGLSGAIFTQIFKSLLGSDAVSLLFFLAVGPTLVCLCCMGFIRPIQPSPTSGRSYHELEEEQRQFQFIYIVCIALAIYLLVAVFLDELITSSLVLHIIVTVMFLFLLTPIFVPLRVLIQGLVFKKKAEIDVKEAFLSTVDPLLQPPKTPDEKGNLGGDKGHVIERALEGEENLSKGGPKVFEADEEDADALLALGEGAVRRKKRRPRRGEDFKLRQALIKADFWLLFFTFFCGVGTAVTATNNLSQLGQAQGYSQVSTFVMLSSVWGFLGRLGGGSVSEHFIRSSTTPRPVWIAAAQALLIVAHLLFALAPPGSLYLASSIMGLCYGIQIAVIVPTASEIFGLKHFGKLYNFITLADPLASLLFSTLLAGNLYDLEVMRQYSVPLREASNLVCTGARCFRLAFLVMAGVCVVGVGLCIILSIRLKPVYITLYGVQDSAGASYSTLSSSPSYNSFPSGYVAAASTPLPVSFTFPHVLSSSSLPQECNEDLR